jgi:hypothetical protein
MLGYPCELRQIRCRSSLAIYYASFLGLDEVLGFMWSTSAADVHAQGGEYGNALQAASWEQEGQLTLLTTI